MSVALPFQEKKKKDRKKKNLLPCPLSEVWEWGIGLLPQVITSILTEVFTLCQGKTHSVQQKKKTVLMATARNEATVCLTFSPAISATTSRSLFLSSLASNRLVSDRKGGISRARDSQNISFFDRINNFQWRAVLQLVTLGYLAENCSCVEDRSGVISGWWISISTMVMLRW